MEKINKIKEINVKNKTKKCESSLEKPENVGFFEKFF